MRTSSGAADSRASDTYEGIGQGPPRPAGAPGLALTVLLFIVEAVVSIAAVLSAMLSAFVGDSCSAGGCNFGLMTFAGYLALIGVVVIFFSSVALCAHRYAALRKTWWVPLAGIAATLVLSVVSWLLLNIGANQF